MGNSSTVLKEYDQKTWDNLSQWSVHLSISPSRPASSSGDNSSRQHPGQTASRDQSEENLHPSNGVAVHAHPVQSLFIYCTSFNVTDGLVTDQGPGLKVLRVHHGGVSVPTVFLFFFLLCLVVDLSDGSFAASTLHQLRDGALAVTFELVQVLVEDLTGTQRRHQVIELPADLV